MCVDPLTLTVASAAMGAAGNLFAGFSKKQESDANAAALETSAQQREQLAKYDIERAQSRFTRQQGTAIAKAGSTNVDVRSFDSVLADDAKESAFEQKAIHVSAQIDEANLRFQKQGQLAQGQASLISGIFSAAGSVVGAGTNYNKMRELDTRYSKLGGVTLDDASDAY